MRDDYPKSADADVTLILEGTFPFVLGGVSGWVHNLITMLPQYRFAAIFLGGQQQDYSGLRYALPKNLVHLETHYLFDGCQANPHSVNTSKKDFTELTNIHQQFKHESTAEFIALGKKLKDQFFNTQSITQDDFLYSRSSWQYIVQNYSEKCPDISFLDYFWAIRNMHMPIWQLAKIAQHAPKSRILHSVSTGYAGYLASLLHYERKCPFILTEHGIYVKERRIDLLTQWVAVGSLFEQRTAQTQQYLTDLWIHFFEVLARLCYAAADPIISLFHAYQRQQINSGAPPERSIIIPNGVPVAEMEMGKSAPSAQTPIIALIGRVVPIKDIKNFIRAMVVIRERIPKAQAWIIGPTDEDKIYVTECKDLINVLGLTEHVHIKGVQKIADIYPQIDLLALSSISEGLPLVVLEAFAAGIPAVVTDVGACSELIYGNTPEDKALGASGIVVEIANANVLAHAVITLLQDPARWRQAQIAAKERVKRFYNQKKFFENYTRIYDEALTWQASDLSYENF